MPPPTMATKKSDTSTGSQHGVVSTAEDSLTPSKRKYDKKPKTRATVELETEACKAIKKALNIDIPADRVKLRTYPYAKRKLDYVWAANPLHAAGLERYEQLIFDRTFGSEAIPCKWSEPDREVLIELVKEEKIVPQDCKSSSNGFTTDDHTFSDAEIEGEVGLEGVRKSSNERDGRKSNAFVQTTDRSKRRRLPSPELGEDLDTPEKSREASMDPSNPALAPFELLSQSTAVSNVFQDYLPPKDLPVAPPPPSGQQEHAGRISSTPSLIYSPRTILMLEAPPARGLPDADEDLNDHLDTHDVEEIDSNECRRQELLEMMDSKERAFSGYFKDARKATLDIFDIENKLRKTEMLLRNEKQLNRNLTAKIETIKAREKALATEITDLKTKSKSYQEQIKQLEQTAIDSRDIVLLKDDTIKFQNKSLNTHMDRVNAQNRKINELERTVAVLEQSKKDALDNQEDLQYELDGVEKDRAKLKVEVESLKAEIQSLKDGKGNPRFSRFG